MPPRSHKAAARPRSGHLDVCMDRLRAPSHQRCLSVQAASPLGANRGTTTGPSRKSPRIAAQGPPGPCVGEYYYTNYRTYTARPPVVVAAASAWRLPMRHLPPQRCLATRSVRSRGDGSFFPAHQDRVWLQVSVPLFP
ncbi:hypothetical protein K505DRAFT_62648 [Melanomma pulvis-pyrius CBS 109.77]|uniref:Uncharacterized protein n=1 Tax=Melanomma pulvis-pyrius CBS 109.77 TaxID=1314802 RepID=A0A6A6XV37_9PLEO|nr:hypothetical protein K505DRAFT_62648 [Melanomma pulvis-pyrius CBS 109.77]